MPWTQATFDSKETSSTFECAARNGIATYIENGGVNRSGGREGRVMGGNLAPERRREGIQQIKLTAFTCADTEMKFTNSSGARHVRKNAITS